MGKVKNMLLQIRQDRYLSSIGLLTLSEMGDEPNILFAAYSVLKSVKYFQDFS
jgi:hypothetical protein